MIESLDNVIGGFLENKSVSSNPQLVIKSHETSAKDNLTVIDERGWEEIDKGVLGTNSQRKSVNWTKMAEDAARRREEQILQVSKASNL